jgi:hypothetical protein
VLDVDVGDASAVALGLADSLGTWTDGPGSPGSAESVGGSRLGVGETSSFGPAEGLAAPSGEALPDGLGLPEPLSGFPSSDPLAGF